MDWLETIKEDLRKATVIKIASDEGTYDYIVNPLSSGVPEIPSEALWGCAFEVAKATELRGASKILAPEAMGIHVATALSMVTGIPLLVIRKKPYRLPGEISVSKKTGYAEERMYIDGVHSGDRVVLVDSIIATGGTYAAIINALQTNGVVVQDAVAVIERPELGGIKYVKQHTGITVKTLIRVALKDGRPEIV